MISATFVGAFRKLRVTGKSPFEGLSSAPRALKSAFSRHNSLVLNVLADQAACQIEERAGGLRERNDSGRVFAEMGVQRHS
jgi:hypothetical protein